MPKFISNGGTWKEVRVQETVITAVNSEPVVVKDEITQDLKYDLNRDGVVDNKDVTIAGELLNKAKRGRKKKEA
jgi:hypothetical protein